MSEKNEALMVLPNGYPVPLAFYDAVVGHVKGVIPELPLGIDFTLKEVCGPVFWNALTRGEQPMAGRIVACMVSRGEIGLEPVGCKHRVPKRYRRP